MKWDFGDFSVFFSTALEPCVCYSYQWRHSKCHPPENLRCEVPFLKHNLTYHLHIFTRRCFKSILLCIVTQSCCSWEWRVAWSTMIINSLLGRKTMKLSRWGHLGTPSRHNSSRWDHHGTPSRHSSSRWDHHRTPWLRLILDLNSLPLFSFTHPPLHV